MSKKQTAVEWLEKKVKEMINNGCDLGEDYETFPAYPSSFRCEMEVVIAHRDRYGNIRTEKSFIKTTMINGHRTLVGNYWYKFI